jgi:hypothetical protein
MKNTITKLCQQIILLKSIFDHEPEKSKKLVARNLRLFTERHHIGMYQCSLLIG